MNHLAQAHPASRALLFLLLVLLVGGLSHPALGEDKPLAHGVVFDDRNGDGQRQANEPGVAGVKVSNGLEVVQTARDGSYALPVHDDMSVMVIQPQGWSVPTNEHGVARFFYTHKPEGSASALRFGGLPPTGPLPEQIDFPLTRLDALR